MKYYKLLFLLLTTGCISNNNESRYKIATTQANENAKVIEVDARSSMKIQFSDIFESIELIPLETNTNCLMGDQLFLKKVINNTYYLHDDTQKSIYLFSRNGTYLDKINNLGKGPGEYIEIADCYVNEKYIYLNGALKILKYDAHTCDFISEVRVPKILGGSWHIFTPDDQTFYLNSTKSPQNSLLKASVYKTNCKLDSIIKAYRTPSINYTPMMFPKPFTQVNENIYYQEGFNDTLYRITPNTLIPEIIIRYNQPTVTPKLYHNRKTIYNTAGKEIPDHLIEMSLLYNFNDTHLFGFYEVKQEIHCFIHWLESGKTLSFKTEDCEDDFFHCIPLHAMMWGVFDQDGYVYFTMRAMYLLDHLRKNNISAPPILSSLKESDNDLIVKVKLKKDFPFQ